METDRVNQCKLIFNVPGAGGKKLIVLRLGYLLHCVFYCYVMHTISANVYWLWKSCFLLVCMVFNQSTSRIESNVMCKLTGSSLEDVNRKMVRIAFGVFASGTEFQ